MASQLRFSRFSTAKVAARLSQQDQRIIIRHFIATFPMSSSSKNTPVLSEVLKSEYWPPVSAKPFDWDVPTNEAYEDIGDTNSNKRRESFANSFQQAREKLDYSYHKNPIVSRQEFQDKILMNVIQGVSQKENKISLERPWILFTAGPMGVGKSYVLSKLFQRGLFPLDSFIKIDPDMLKSELPEMPGYLANGPESAATKLHRESTQMADVMFEHALASKSSILVDGSLRDVEWYKTLFGRIRKEFPKYRLGILYVSASQEIIRKRAESRASMTGRAVPEVLLQNSIDQVPRSVAALSPLTDTTFEISNNDGQPLSLVQKPSNITNWVSFRNFWNDDNVEGTRIKQEEEIIICDIVNACLDPKEHDIIQSLWGCSYPNICPRCALHSDKPCGICVHGSHLCYCKICSPSAAALQ